MGLEWDDNLNNFQRTALRRGRIKTPSYSQVTEPLYTDATYRWKNYEVHLRKYLSQLSPWLDKFGYKD